MGVELATGAERLVATLPDPGLDRAANNQCGLAISPDGTMIAIEAWADISKATIRLITMGIDGSNYREIFGPFSTSNTPDEMSWTPDSRSIRLFHGRRPPRAAHADQRTGRPRGVRRLDFQHLMGAATLPQLFGAAGTST